MKFFLKRLQTIFFLSFTLSVSAVQSYAAFNENDPVNNRYSASYNHGEKINCGRGHSPPLSHTKKSLGDSQCIDFFVVYPLAKSLIPITNILLTHSEPKPKPKPKPKTKTCGVELTTTKTWAFSSWYSTFTRQGGCQIKLRLICDGSESACSPSVGDYSSSNKFQVIIFDDKTNYKKETLDRTQNTEKANVTHHSTIVESTDNMMVENKGSGTANISYITSSCYNDIGPSSFHVNSGSVYSFTVKTSNAYNLVQWWSCWDKVKTISWKIEYTTYE
ncbi:hypothetical protein [Xenorhabdus ehlersii]|uniref:Uncharacterized protein n=1 Tax=Xenorhabdus ehlersii TaxID=290111 RepID=A0A2D0ILL3_9GAMM|nr:hypothetical protein [Xenorhabdus ehlersii]PHM22697.1 hypothetical protein Xehl_03464 [Xenorhabdus ehlersii]RKE91504.1 hypothetical protein BDE27_1748 [Xenorhabdus ehlersii]